MPCIEASIPQIPIPAFALFLPTLSITIPAVGLNLCCNFQLPFLPLGPLEIPLGAILALLGPSLDTVLALIKTAIDTVNSYLDMLRFSFSCPLD
jgi:hypothetical protein